MKTLIVSHAKLNVASADEITNVVGKKLVNSTIRFDYKLYQKLFVMLLSLCTFLIFPESPEDFNTFCKKYHSKEACTVW